MNKENKEDQLSWFHGKITRDESEEILRNDSKEDGIFLVRESSTSNGDFVLSVRHQDDVCHYQIRRHGEDAFFSIKDNIKIHGLDSLIEFYQKSSNGLVTKLSDFVKNEPPPNDVRSHGRTNLLHRATKENNQVIVSELLKCGYRNFDAKTQDGQTAVHLACLNNNEEVLKLLLNAGANVNCRDTAGNTPLHYACRSNPESFIKILLDAKANIQTRNIETGCVPLHDAAAFGNLNAVETLLEAGAPHLPRTSSGEFPVDLALEKGHHKIVDFLKKYNLPSLDITKSEWYHGTLDRVESEKILKVFAEDLVKKMMTDRQNGNNAVLSNEDQVKQIENQLESLVDVSGSFLIRYSNRSGYVLTLWSDNNVKHFKILEAMKCLYIDEGPYLLSLEHLVKHYSLFSDGLPVNLRFPVPPRPKPPLPLFSTMPKTSPKTQSDPLGGGSEFSPNHKSIGSRIPHRNLSHPGDDAMNRVGLFESGSSPPLRALSTVIDNSKKSKDKRDIAIFRSLKPRSPKRNYIIDGMRSLRKSKLKSPSKNEIKTPEEQTSPSRDPEADIRNAESLMKSLCFSSDFINQSGLEGFYNVPKNNCAIVDIDIGETSNLKKNEDKNETECDYFTKSDKIIELERMENNSTEVEEVYFVDPPPRINLSTYPVLSEAGLGPTPNAAGYIPTADIRVFMEENFQTSKSLAESSAELRELSKYPERLDSIISTTASEDFALFQRQTSNASTTTENSKSRLNFFIPCESLKLDQIIGEGEFGSVYKGNYLTTINIEVAIKTLRDEQCRTNKQEFLREASTMIRLQHHCIVKLIGISKSQTGIMMVQELLLFGSMLNFIVQNPEKINPKYELKLWASQIACGMQYLESHHFVHRDLAARNILLASRNQAKISDFGLSRALGSENDCYQASQGGKWPIKWYAPESFNHGTFSHASDVWSFGITLWEMFSMGQPPYGDMRGVDAIKLIDAGERLPQPSLCPDNVYEIMNNCWKYKPRDRPTFRYLTEFFSSDPGYQNLTELVKSEHIS